MVIFVLSNFVWQRERGGDRLIGSRRRLRKLVPALIWYVGMQRVYRGSIHNILIAMQIKENGDHILAGFSQKGVNSSGEVHDHDATHAHGQIEARVEDGWARKRRFVCIPGTHRTEVMWPNGAELRTAVEWVQRTTGNGYNGRYGIAPTAAICTLSDYTTDLLLKQTRQQDSFITVDI